MMRNEWTDEQVDMLKGGCANGMSFSQIAYRINRETGGGFSRSAMIGKAHRLGLHNGHAPFGADSSDRPKPKPKPGPRAKRTTPFVVPPVSGQMRPDLVAAIVSRPPPGPFLGIALLDLEPEHCRYPRGGDVPGEPILFCGQPKQEGSSYCADCHARCNTSAGRGLDGRYYFGERKARAA